MNTHTDKSMSYLNMQYQLQIATYLPHHKGGLVITGVSTVMSNKIASHFQSLASRLSSTETMNKSKKAHGRNAHCQYCHNILSIRV